MPAYLKKRNYMQQLWPQVSWAISMALIPKSEVKKIMAPDLRVLRGAFYLSRTFSGELLRLPEKYGGYGIKELHAALIKEQVKLVLSSLRGEGNTTKKLVIMINYHQLELGLRLSIFDERAHRYLDLLTNTWLVQVIKRTRKRNLTIRTNKKCQWSGATPTIMDCVLESDMS